MKYPFNEISYLSNILSMKYLIYTYLIYEAFYLWNILSMKYPDHEMFYLWNILSMKHPIYEAFYQCNILSMKYPVYEMFYLWNILSMKYPIWEILGVVFFIFPRKIPKQVSIIIFWNFNNSSHCTVHHRSEKGISYLMFLYFNHNFHVLHFGHEGGHLRSVFFNTQDTPWNRGVRRNMKTFLSSYLFYGWGQKTLRNRFFLVTQEFYFSFFFFWFLKHLFKFKIYLNQNLRVLKCSKCLQFLLVNVVLIKVVFRFFWFFHIFSI